MAVIQIDQQTLKETVALVTPELPYMTELCYVNDCPDGCFPWHWHGEVEFFYMRSGCLEYHVPGEMQLFCEGDAGFVNANVLHMTRVPPGMPSVQEEHIFSPAFIAGPTGGAVESKYIRPVLRSGNVGLVRFRNPQRAIELMRRAHDLYVSREDGFEMRVAALMQELWLLLFEETREQRTGRNVRKLDDERIKNMLSYINDHFSEHIALEDIAAAGYVGERECFRIFRRNLDTTPMDYLTGKRVAYAAELLRTTTMQVLEIGLKAGFCSGSYFGKVFRERMGMTPREYRKTL